METSAERRKHARSLLKILKKTYPDARLALDFANPLELLIALILAAQCTDERVNRVTSVLFKQYKTASDWATLDRKTLEEEIHPTGFYRNKARAIQECTAMVVKEFGGKVPATVEDLLTLPGVGRKTANILLGNAFGIPAIGVDTHVGRVSYRLGLTDKTDPDKIEADLVQVIPKPDWVKFCHQLQFHGRQICLARTPKCTECPVSERCPKVGV